MAKGVVKVEPEPELELGRLGPRVSRSPSSTSGWQLLGVAAGSGGLNLRWAGVPGLP